MQTLREAVSAALTVSLETRHTSSGRQYNTFDCATWRPQLYQLHTAIVTNVQERAVLTQNNTHHLLAVTVRVCVTACG